MNPQNFVLVAYARNALRQASHVAEILKPFAEVQLCSYDLSREQLPQEPDAVLCIVTDEESIEMAHDFQGRLEDVPAFVVDNSGSLKIELNGYAGRVSSSPDQVLGAVRQFLAANGRRNFRTPQREPRRTHRKISTPFNHILARAAGGGQPAQAILIAATRQLSSDLRAERAEVFQHMAETNGVPKDLCGTGNRQSKGFRSFARGDSPDQEAALSDDSRRPGVPLVFPIASLFDREEAQPARSLSESDSLTGVDGLSPGSRTMHR